MKRFDKNTINTVYSQWRLFALPCPRWVKAKAEVRILALLQLRNQNTIRCRLYNDQLFTTAGLWRIYPLQRSLMGIKWISMWVNAFVLTETATLQTIDAFLTVCDPGLTAGHPQEASGEGSVWAAVSDRGPLHPEEERGGGAHRPREQNREWFSVTAGLRVFLSGPSHRDMWTTCACCRRNVAPRGRSSRGSGRRERRRGRPGSRYVHSPVTSH